MVKILLDAIGSASIGSENFENLEGGGCRVAFTGGAGIADHWKGNARGPGEWRDLQIRLEGPAVVPLQTGFAHNWQQTTGELLSGDAYYPEPDGSGPLAVQTLLSSPETG